MKFKIIILVIGLLVIAFAGAGYYGWNLFKNYQAEQSEKELQNLEQRELLEKTGEELEKLKAENRQTKLQLEKTIADIQKYEKLTNKEIISKVKPAVVYIETKETAGSGIILDSNGFILTNAHVVDDSPTAAVKLSDGRSFTGSVIGRDDNIDLAILKIEGNNFPFVEFGNSDAVEQGDEVFALGYPFGLRGDVSFKEGTISRRLVDEELTYLETSVEIHPGNSGGPLINIYGQVIGINTATLGKTVRGVSLGETIKLAIPSNKVIELIPSLKKL